MMGKRTTPDPLDTTDPRVKVSDVDQLGQTYGPGDYVVLKGYGGLQFGRVQRIQALRNDGTPLTSGSPTKVHFHWIRPDKKGGLEFAYYKRKSWDIPTQTLIDQGVFPITGAIKHPASDLVRCDWLRNLPINDDPGSAA